MGNSFSNVFGSMNWGSATQTGVQAGYNVWRYTPSNRKGYPSSNTYNGNRAATMAQVTALGNVAAPAAGGSRKKTRKQRKQKKQRH